MLLRMRLPVSVRTILFAVLLSSAAHSQGPRVFLVAPSTLAAQKAHPDAVLLKLTLHGADAALRVKPYAVTDKPQTPPSGDKHDYTSLSRYFWPNPATPDHLPYIRKDGQTNPELDAYSDQKNIVHIGKDSRTLALAYYLTGKTEYADKAALLLRHFFLDADTRMNPNMQYAQFVPGLYNGDGRGSGVLDARWLVYVVDAVGMLEGSKAWTAADQKGMTDWFSRYYEWLTTSKNGLHEMAAPNNHGSWYAAQQTAIASFLGKTGDVRAAAERIRDKRIPSQFDRAGMQKFELVRTNSFSYSAFNLEALSEVARIVAPTGIDLYAVKPGMIAGLDALLPFDAQHPWPHEQISKEKFDAVCAPLYRFAAHTGDPKYMEAQKRFGCEPDLFGRLDSLPERQ